MDGKKLRMWCKTCLILAGLLFFCFLAGRYEPGIDYEKEARLREYEMDESVEKKKLMILADNGRLMQTENGAQKVLTTEGIFDCQMEHAEDFLYQTVTAYICEQVILEVSVEEKQKETVLKNLWLMETEADRALCFWEGNRFYLPITAPLEEREQVADITLYDGSIKKWETKREKRTGKLLRVTQAAAYLQGEDAEITLPFDKDMRVYRLYGELEESSWRELPLGSEAVDFVMEGENVCACLISEPGEKKTIRVLLQSGNYAGYFHEQLSLTADCAYETVLGKEKKEHAAGEVLTISWDDDAFAEEERMIVTASVNTEKLELLSIQRGREKTKYRGTLEILKTAQGFLVINELPLEEYLYGVVPSEMPASYPAESLKAQAVCARTYACRYLETAGLPEFGAHVDDSTAYQVYGNTEEKAETTEAVKETAGEILTFQGQALNTYYYSTSCGYGTDERAWGAALEEPVCLLAKSLSNDWKDLQACRKAAEEIKAEDAFTEFISSKAENFLESSEPWFRWQYQVEKADSEEIERRLSKRYELQPDYILTRTGENDYISQPIERLGELKALRILERNAGGSADALLIEGSERTYLVRSEYNIRYVLCDGKAEAVRADGSCAACPTLLPSAFLALAAGKDEKNMIGYTVYGGGYGHGIGMSQNGAKSMALSGASMQEILSFFYEGSQIEDVY